MWPPNIHEALTRIRTAYASAYRVLQQEDADPLQISYHIDQITSTCIPLLVSVEEEELLPKTWLRECAELLGNVVVELRRFLAHNQER